MSADSTEQGTAEGGPDLRNRYLPVSRKELRRRREAELAAQREEEGSAQEQDPNVPHTSEQDVLHEQAQEDDAAEQEPTEALGENDDESALVAEPLSDEEAPRPEEELADLVREVAPEEAQDAQDAHDHQDAEPSAETEDAGSQTEADDVSGPDDSGPQEAESQEGEPQEPSADEAESDDDDDDGEQSPDSDAPSSQELESGAAEQAESDALDDSEEDTWLNAEEDEDLLSGSEPADADSAGDEAETAESAEQTLSSDHPETEGLGAPGPSEELPRNQKNAQESTGSRLEHPELLDPTSTASRRARRFLRETSGIPVLSPELIAEIESTTSEIQLSDDPDHVDPVLLKKQQELAAKAKRANEERMRRHQAQGHQQGSSELTAPEEEGVVAERALRESSKAELPYPQDPTDSIEPVKAQGAHGLDLDRMVDATSKHAERQHMLLWLVVVLAVLLVIAVGTALYFIVF